MKIKHILILGLTLAGLSFGAQSLYNTPERDEAVGMILNGTYAPSNYTAVSSAAMEAISFERSICILGVGHSQMVGTPDDDWSGEHLEIVPDAYLYNQYTDYLGGLKAIAPSQGGVEISASRWLLENNFDQVYFGKAALGGTTLWGDWNPDTGPMYPRITNTVETVYDAYGRRPDIVWYWLGQNDTGTDNGWVYPERCTNFIERLRADIGDETIPVIIIETAYRAQIQRAEAGIAARLPNVYFLDTTDVTEDPTTSGSVHLLTDGLLVVGEQLAEMSKDILTGRDEEKYSVSDYGLVIDCDFEHGVSNSFHGYTAVDLSTNDSGLVWEGADRGVVYDATEQGNSFYFAGAADICGNDFTICFDVTTTNNYGTRDSFATLVGWHASDANFTGHCMFQSWNGDETWRIINGAAPLSVVSGGIVQEEYQRIIWQYDASTSNNTFSANGIYSADYALTSSPLSGNGQLYFSFPASGKSACAQFDNIKVWTRLLSRSEIEQLQKDQR